MNNIQKVSLFFRFVFMLAVLIMPVSLVISWVYAPHTFSLFDGIINLSSIPDPYIGEHATAIMHQMSGMEKFAGFLLSSIPMAIKLFIALTLIKLFGLYQKGEIFSLNTVRHTRNIGYALVIGEAIYPFYQFAMGFILTANNPPGYRFAAISLNQTNFGIMLVGLLVVLISWIMAEGCKLYEEQQLTA